MITLSCRNNDWVYDKDDDATFSKIEKYEDTFYETEEAIIVGSQLGIQTSTIDVTEDLEREVEICEENQLFDMNNFSFQYSLPNNENSYSVDADSWYTRGFYECSYILSFNIKLRHQDKTISSYNYFPGVENDGERINILDIYSKYTFSIQFPILRRIVDFFKDLLEANEYKLSVLSIIGLIPGAPLTPFLVPVTIVNFLTQTYDEIEKNIQKGNAYLIECCNIFII